MKERSERLEAIKKILESEEIASQDELFERLCSEGFEMAKTTLSRDLKFLRVCKIVNKDGNYIYSLPKKTVDEVGFFAENFVRNHVSIEFSGSIAVVRTLSGFTDIVSMALDLLMTEVIVGTVAGNDNCVFACIREGVTREQFLKKLQENILSHAKKTKQNE